MKLPRATSFAVAAIIALAVGPLPSRTAAAALSDSAVSWQIDPAHIGVQSGETLAPPLVEKWSTPLGPPVSDALVVNNLVYVTFGAQAGTRLIALNLADGTIAWGPIDLGGGGGRAELGYDNGRVFVNTGEDFVIAYDALTGARDWLGSGGNTIPVAVNGIVYSSGQAETTGANSWHPVQQPNEPPMQYVGPPAVTATGVYFANACGPVWDFDPSDGHEIWRTASGCLAPYGPIPNVYQGRVYVDSEAASTTGSLTGLVLDAATGAQLGTFGDAPERAFDGQNGFFLESPGPLTLRARPLLALSRCWRSAGRRSGHSRAMGNSIRRRSSSTASSTSGRTREIYTRSTR